MLGAPVGEQNTAVQTAEGARPKAAAAADASGMQAQQDAPVRSIMTAKVISFHVDTSLEEATRVMLDRGISGAPVVDKDGRPVGMLSKTDLLEAWHEHGPSTKQVTPPALHAGDRVIPAAPLPPSDSPRAMARVGDIMVPYLLAVSGQAPISLAAALMAYEGVHRLLVLGEGNEMEGIVTALDVLRWLAQLSGFCLPHCTQRQRA